jgi:phosphohistidine phosphatase
MARFRTHRRYSQPMDLYVIRHALAEDAVPGEDDAARPLTAAGERKFRKAVQGLRELDWRFERVVTSPWQRALRTAELLAPVSDDDPIQSDLLCRPPTTELLALISEVTGPAKPGRGTAVVGHEPWLGELISWLAFGDPKQGDSLALRKGGMAWLVGSAVPGGMELRAIVTPKLLRALR